jgi:hypothetical protein
LNYFWILFMAEIDAQIQPSVVNNETTAATNDPVDIGKLLGAIDSIPGAREALARALAPSQASVPLPLPVAESVSPQPVNQPLATPAFDLVNAPLSDFVSYTSGGGDPKAELRAHLLMRFSDLDGRTADDIVHAADRKIRDSFEITKNFPSDYAKALRTNSVLITQELQAAYVHETNRRNELFSEHYRIAEREFGANNVEVKKREMEDYFVETLSLPKEELALFAPDRYKALVNAYARKNITTAQETAEVRAQKSAHEKIVNIVRAIRS